MGLSTVRKDLHPPAFSLTFTTFAAPRILHDGGASCPTGVAHLPCGMLVNAAVNDVLAFKDAFGVTNTITFAAATVVWLPVAASTLEAATTCDSVTVSWHPEP